MLESIENMKQASDQITDAIHSLSMAQAFLRRIDNPDRHLEANQLGEILENLIKTRNELDLGSRISY